MAHVLENYYLGHHDSQLNLKEFLSDFGYTSEEQSVINDVRRMIDKARHQGTFTNSISTQVSDADLATTLDFKVLTDEGPVRLLRDSLGRMTPEDFQGLIQDALEKGLLANTKGTQYAQVRVQDPRMKDPHTEDGKFTHVAFDFGISDSEAKTAEDLHDEEVKKYVDKVDDQSVKANEKIEKLTWEIDELKKQLQDLTKSSTTSTTVKSDETTTTSSETTETPCFLYKKSIILELEQVNNRGIKKSSHKENSLRIII